MLGCVSLIAATAVCAQQEQQEQQNEPQQGVARRSKVSRADFAAYVAMGRPLVITDATKTLPLDGMTCEKFASTFSGANMRQEYTNSRRILYDEQEGYFDNNTQSIHDLDWINARISSGAPSNTGGPPFAPFYFGVKEGDMVRVLHSFPCRKRVVAQKLLELFVGAGDVQTR